MLFFCFHILIFLREQINSHIMHLIWQKRKVKSWITQLVARCHACDSNFFFMFVLLAHALCSLEGPRLRVSSGGGGWCWGIQRSNSNSFHLWNVFSAFSHVIIITYEGMGKDYAPHYCQFDHLPLICFFFCIPRLSEATNIYLATFFFPCVARISAMLK